MYDIASVLNLAKSQVGYHESRSGGHWDNGEKYAAQVPGMAWANHQPWCDVFVAWCLSQGGVQVPAGAVSASCATSVAAFKKAGRFTEYPVVGAQVFYGPGGGSHTGIVTGWDDTHVFTVEGNTNTNGSAEGDGVYAKTRIRRDAFVYGYGIPYYENDHANTPDPVWRNKPLGR